MLQVNVVAHPGARQQHLELLEDDALAVWVRQRAVDNKANAAIEQAVAGALGLRPRQVQLTVGHSSRRKIIEIDLPDLAQLRARMLAHTVRSG
jgi:uncharacterized protein YggU (UPF0235/DUF167 family)